MVVLWLIRSRRCPPASTVPAPLTPLGLTRCISSSTLAVIALALLFFRPFAEFRGHVKRPPLLRPEREQYLADLFSQTRRLRWELIDSGRFDLARVDAAGYSGAGEREFGYQCVV